MRETERYIEREGESERVRFRDRGGLATEGV